MFIFKRILAYDWIEYEFISPINIKANSICTTASKINVPPKGVRKTAV